MCNEEQDTKPKLAWYENNQDLIEPVSLYLIKYFNVVIFSDGRTALNDIIKFEPDIVLLDCYMDHLSGIELYRELAPALQKIKGNSVPVFFLTLWARDESTRNEIIKEGVDESRILYKDIKGKSLAKTLWERHTELRG